MKEKFPKMSEAKLKEGIFVGSHRRKFLKDPTFDANLTNLELTTWSSFKTIVHGFSMKRLLDNYVSTMSDLLENSRTLGVECTEKIHVLRVHLDFSQERAE